MEGILGITWLFWIVALLVFYHKVFTVYYFSLGNAIMKELFVAAFIGGIMALLTLSLWWLTAIIIIVVGLVNMGKSGNKAHIVVAVILAIAISIIGISATGSSDTTEALAPTSLIEYTI
jgi:hypothetical protein